ncbi:MAG: hypothetical protein MRERV_18c010 [Mycoplasmataceae bacterium RV_VA103A]|nr:MAG: hypothetical protein MRERV_18c010 [Mycoplasmataceae bacterium RV_VA103A]
MTWNQYKTYLQTKILQEEEDTYLLSPEAKKKYSPSKESELIQVLTNLIISIDNLPTYSSLQENEEYHSLPDLDLYTEQGQLITWPQLFPDRTQTHFGKKEIKTKISLQTWTTLSKIFSDFTHQTTRAKKLQNFLTQEELLLKLISEALINLNYDLIKQKGYDSIVRNWLKEYELLEKDEKKQLTKEYGLMSNLLISWEEVKKMKESSWYQQVSWKPILWYGCGGLLVLLVIGWLWKKLND